MGKAYVSRTEDNNILVKILYSLCSLEYNIEIRIFCIFSISGLHWFLWRKQEKPQSKSTCEHITSICESIHTICMCCMLCKQNLLKIILLIIWESHIMHPDYAHLSYILSAAPTSQICPPSPPWPHQIKINVYFMLSIYSLEHGQITSAQSPKWEWVFLHLCTYQKSST